MIGLSLLNEPSMFLTYIGLSIFFNLNLYFLTNSELITSTVVPLFNSASTVISFCMSILSSPIFTVTSLNNFSSSAFLTSTSFFSLILSESDTPTFISLASTLNLLLESSWGTLDSLPLLNCLSVQNFPLLSISVHIPVFCHLQFWFFPSYFYNVRQYTRIYHKCSNFSLYLLLLHRGFFEQPLSSVKDISSLHSFSLLSPLEQALLLSAETVFPTFSATLVVMAFAVPVA